MDLDNFLTSRFQSLETVSEIRNFEPLGSSSRPALETLSNPKRGVRSFSTRLNWRVWVYCSGDHLMNISPKFLDISPERRFSVAKRYSLCINCLLGGHRLNECSVCKFKHHALLHREVSRSPSDALDTSGSSGAV